MTGLPPLLPLAVAGLHQQSGDITRAVAVLNQLHTTAIAAACLLSALGLIRPAVAGTFTGLATSEERIARPPDAVGRLPASCSNRLVLRGGREAPLFFQPMDGGSALKQLDLPGQPIPTLRRHRLQRLAAYAPIDPRLHLQGMFSYLADAASIRLCATDTRLPVAMEGDYLSLERAYLKALPAGAAGTPLLVNLEGLITSRPSAEPGRPPQRTLVVERFVGVHPGQGCP